MGHILIHNGTVTKSQLRVVYESPLNAGNIWKGHRIGLKLKLAVLYMK